MTKFVKKTVAAVRGLLALASKSQEANDDLKILIGRVLAESVINKRGYGALAELEFKVFSQFGDDGIIQYLAHNLDLRHKTFVEFGVEDYLESNTRFLLQKDNWSGFFMDASEQNMDKLKKASFFWKHDLVGRAAFVTEKNINSLLSEGTDRWPGVDFLHIDIDGNDYWIWKQIDLDPAIVVVEYNSTFGIDCAITVPYDPDFYRTTAHFSNLYWGTSLKALYILAQKKDYQFVGCNSAGNNAYFVRSDMMNEYVNAVALGEGFVLSKYRESINEVGELTYVAAAERAEIIRGLPVFDIEQGAVVPY